MKSRANRSNIVAQRHNWIDIRWLRWAEWLVAPARAGRPRAASP